MDVTANLVDLTGNLSISGASQVNVTSNGDIRLNGVLNSQAITLNGVQYDPNTVLTGSLVTQGNVTLQASQVYPTTMSQFKVSVVDGSATSGRYDHSQSNNPASPANGSTPVLSAGGQVTLSADTIEQDGVLKAPMGTIMLDGTRMVLGSGSLTSVSAEGPDYSFRIDVGGTGWVYNLAGNNECNGAFIRRCHPARTAAKTDRYSGKQCQYSEGCGGQPFRGRRPLRQRIHCGHGRLG